MQTEWDDAHQALLAKRRLRATDDEPLWVIHTLRTVGGAPTLAWETDRMRFIGRGRTTARPQSLDAGAELSGTTGAVLDPIFALRTEVTLAPGASTRDARAARRRAHEGGGRVDRRAARSAGCASDASPPRAKGASSAMPARPADRYRPARAPEATMIANADEPLRFFNGIGGFSSDGTEYVIRLDATPSGLRWPPMPWSNVIANENAGCIVTASGAVTSWTANSRENRLTPWFNDPVSDPLGEAIYLREDGSGVFWSPLPGPTPAPGTVRGAPRLRLHELEAHEPRARADHHDVDAAPRSREARAPDAAKHERAPANDHGHELRASRARRLAVGNGAERRDRARCEHGRDLRDESLARRVLEARCVRRARRSRGRG